MAEVLHVCACVVGVVRRRGDIVENDVIIVAVVRIPNVLFPWFALGLESPMNQV